ncbi:HupE/UreJ family protein [Aurantibacter crassamenti]|uniref:HupE/UreJ family protein n=1 Tax=Aurantibacter crassamenti TaxID=1837375 RepID=UPI00193A874B|nr:HupE/UreJ family protein [Aurantibacter crassamenti]MBM1106808.1 HupE/UreJ family protein [Aurantibacter crassamenti]
MAKYIRILALVLFLAPLFSLQAHAPNQSYIFLRVFEEGGLEARFELNVREINKLFGTNFANDVSLEELQPYVTKVQEYLKDKVDFSSTYGNHQIIYKEVALRRLGMGNFLLMSFDLENTEKVPDNLEVDYRAVFEKDNTHRGILVIEHFWKAGKINNEKNISLIFSPDETKDTLSLTDSSIWQGFMAMIEQGIYHIWIGLDHILFLLALILPSVVRRFRNSKEPKVATGEVAKSGFITWDWFPVENFKPAFLYIVKVVTFFTIAHTITLSLASLEIINLPSRLVESVIALSIGLAAYHNIRPIFNGKDWVIAFVFGLFHGFGFASVLSDLGLTSEFLTFSLLGFNIGVEIGQLCIIALIFPILFFIRKRKSYPKILVYGSILLIVISLYWFLERALDVDLLIEGYIRAFLRTILESVGLLKPIA